MELIYLIIFMCTISGVMCENGRCGVGLILSIVTNVILVIIIICLSIALYMVRNNRSFFGINIRKQPTYTRQESAPGVTLCSVTSTNNITNTIEPSRDDGSTLTVNSGIVEIGGLTEPETPTRFEDNRMPYNFKKPKGPTIPTMQKAQMDKIIEDVLNRKQKSDSATFRDLDALAKPKTLKTYDDEFMIRRNSASLNKLDALANNEFDEGDECLYENAQAINEKKNKLLTASKDKTKKEVQDKPIHIPKIQVLKQAKSADSLQSRLQAQEDNDEHEVYDTVPNPVRCNSNVETDEYVENIHVYDLPPRRSWEKNKPNLFVDQDSQYLMPLSKNRLTEGQEKTCYINAKLLN